METVRNLAVEQTRDMIHSIDTSLTSECRDFDTYTRDGRYLAYRRLRIR